MAHKIFGVAAPYRMHTMDPKKRGYRFRYEYGSFADWLHESPRLGKDKVPVLWNHDESQVLAPPAALKWRQGWVGLEYEAMLPDTEAVRRVLREHRAKQYQVSLGFTNFAPQIDSDGVELVRMGIIFELSIVPRAAVHGCTLNVAY
jgi:hypothetical protein